MNGRHPGGGFRTGFRAGESKCAAATSYGSGARVKSDYPIVEDGYLSGLHFAVEFDGTQCRIRDLGSSNGTFVNGSRVTELVVQDGDSVVAGGSTFVIHVDLLPSITAVGMRPVPTRSVGGHNQGNKRTGVADRRFLGP